MKEQPKIIFPNITKKLGYCRWSDLFSVIFTVDKLLAVGGFNDLIFKLQPRQFLANKRHQNGAKQGK